MDTDIRSSIELKLEINCCFQEKSDCLHLAIGKNYRLLVSLPRLALTKSCMLTQ